MSERFLDKILHFMGIQDEDEEVAAADEELDESEVDDEDVPMQRKRLVRFPNREAVGPREQLEPQSPPISAVPGPGTVRWRMVVLEPTSFDEVQTISDHLKARRPVIVSVEGLDKDLSKRIIDFVSGTTYAIDGNIQRVGESIFVFTPQGVQVEADLRQQWGMEP